MNKAIVMTLLMFGLVIGFSGPMLLAAEQTSQPKSEKRAEKEWYQALKTQVALANTKVSLLRARSELWINKNKESSVRSLEEAKMYLTEAYKSADRSTRARIAGLKTQMETAKSAIYEKGQQAGSELADLADRSQVALNTAIAETNARATALKDETATRLALTQAKASALKAKIALELEKSPEKAKQALTEAEGYLAEAKASASQWAGQGIAKLQTETREAKKSLTGNIKGAKVKLDALISHTGEQLKAYGTRVKDSEGVNLLRKRYAQLEAQAALLKARLAAEKAATYEQAQLYLEEAKGWYTRTRSRAEDAGRRQLVAMEKHIDEAGVVLKDKGKQARNKLSDLIIQAAEIVKGEK
jgi:hypothetical protein